MSDMTDEERKEIAESMNAMSDKLDRIAKMLNDIMRQNAVVYYAVTDRPEKAKTMAVQETEVPPPPNGQKQRVKKKVKAEVDEGRIKALHDAGWILKDIADDCGVSISTVYRVLNPEKAHG